MKNNKILIWAMTAIIFFSLLLVGYRAISIRPHCPGEDVANLVFSIWTCEGITFGEICIGKVRCGPLSHVDVFP